MLGDIFDKILSKLDNYFNERESFFNESRALLYHLRKAFAAVHSKDIKKAESEIIKINELKDTIISIINRCPRLAYHNAWIDLAKEIAEFFIFYEIMKGVLLNGEMKVPSDEDIGVPEEAWILGLCEATGELKRQAVMFLTEDDINKALTIYDTIKEIYNLVSVIPYPSSIIPGIKGKIDYVRHILLDLEEKIVEIKLHNDLKKKIEELLFKLS